MGGAISGVADIFGLGPASKQADATTSAANASAGAQLAAAQIAADASRFRPVGVTNTFGTSSFGTDAAGNVNSANYTLSPQLQAYQNFLAGQGGQAQGDVQGLLNLGRGYLGESPDAVKQRYISQQQALLAPENEQALAGIRNNLFQTGRTGLATGATQAGGLAATNPEMAAYYNALAQQQNQLAAGAEQAAQQQVSFGQGLLSSAYSPLQTNLGVQQSIEALGQDPFVLGMNIGGKNAQAGGQAGSALLQGGLSAAESLQAGSGYSPTASAMYGLANAPGVNRALGTWWNSSPSSTTNQDVIPQSTFNGSGSDYSQMGTEQGWW
jgi:hypothetical protein